MSPAARTLEEIATYGGELADCATENESPTIAQEN